jgi:hypothetical protein
MPATVELGIVSAPGASLEHAEQLADDLPPALGSRLGDYEWRVSVHEADPAEPSADTDELFGALRRRLVDERWELAVGLTELPLRSRRQPVTAQANPQYGVGLVSLPALGGVKVRERLRDAAERVVEGIVGGDARVGELAAPLGEARAREDGTIRFVGAALRGNLRLLAGTVRANQPATVIMRLSRALTGSLGTGAFALASSNVWMLADGTTWRRLVLLAVLSTLATVVALILAHGLWERTDDPRARERVVLFNLATAITIGIGVVFLYAGLFLVTITAALALIPPDVLEQQLKHGIDAGDYVQLAWLVTTLATIGGALGSLVESDLSVRNAAQRSTEAERREGPVDER